MPFISIIYLMNDERVHYAQNTYKPPLTRAQNIYKPHINTIATTIYCVLLSNSTSLCQENL